MTEHFFCSILELADDHLILGHRLSEWCGHAPTLEEDLSLPNLGLDMLGVASSLYSLASNIDVNGRCDDQLAFDRPEREYKSCLLMEKPNEHFGYTMLKQLYFSVFMELYWERCISSNEETVSGIAGKAIKEIAYHIRHSGEWVIRLGDGTKESHARMLEAINELHPYTDELFYMSESSMNCLNKGYLPDRCKLRGSWKARINGILKEATLPFPKTSHFHIGGRSGVHTESMGHLISEMQYLQRTYPGQKW